MPTFYSTIAGRSVERLAALSDGVFAITMTLLVLDLRVPAAAVVHGEGDLFRHVFVALAVGAALCVVSSYLSIAFIILLQLCSVLDLRVTRRLLG